MVARQVTPGAGEFLRVADVAELRAAGCKVVHAGGHTVALFNRGDRIYAVDNRCPHMGFPLDRGTLSGCILTCHWHHARFDLTSGGTFDPWADDLRIFPVEVRGGEIWIDVAPRGDGTAQRSRRLREGLERNLPLVIAKSVIFLSDLAGMPGQSGAGGAVPHPGGSIARQEAQRLTRTSQEGVAPHEPLRAGLQYGCAFRREGFGQGLTILACMGNLLGYLDDADRPRALYHGLGAVAIDSDGSAPRFGLRPLPGSAADPATLKGWFRQFIEVRDAEGAERCILTALEAGASAPAMADMLFAAATDHRYIRTGHVLDFINKALEALDQSGWEHAGTVLSSLTPGLAGADRMEESNAWRHPVDLVCILERAFPEIPGALALARKRREAWQGREELTRTVLGDDPQATATALLDSLRAGASMDQLAQAVAVAAALRIAHFHTSNEFGDWDTALHTFTFANAVHQGLRRAPSPELLRGVFDAAMSVYLDRFLNVPAVRLPEPEPARDPAALLSELPGVLDRQQQVNESADLVAAYLRGGGERRALLAAIGRLLLREDRDFHTIQAVEAAFAQQAMLAGTPAADHVIIAAVRYLAAHAPTSRAQGQTYEIARRLHRGDRLYEGE